MVDDLLFELQKVPPLPRPRAQVLLEPRSLMTLHINNELGAERQSKFNDFPQWVRLGLGFPPRLNEL